ncbi:type II toxin-antitoxin system RelE/ParE family toxin [Methylopila sp. M107]|uniref:type II toxin-antitoxin system RelE/ParE family toxin n=1 Tax=Methylopila sp. M107 TaxID=1101190 RepID=UPI0003824680|nr:type II toxin-antitoxin system RelE/ParE family toxin [Methylopila sp. M107]
MRQIRFDEGVAAELDEIFDWILNDNPAAARRVLLRIMSTIDGLKDFSTGRIGRIAGTREKVVVGYPYLIVYSLATTGNGEETIDIHSIRHTSRRPLG